MKANIKIKPWLPLIFIVVTIGFLFQEFNALDAVLIVATTIIVVYYVLAYIRSKDALIIDEQKLIVRTPFFHREYDLKDISNISIEERNSVIRGLYRGNNTILVTAIYDVSLSDIMAYLIQSQSQINEEISQKG